MLQCNTSSLFPPYFIKSIFILLFIRPLYSSASPTDLLTSCLSRHNINNFTTFPGGDQTDSTAYYNLLNFSIQNLRFAGPRVPKPIAIMLPENVEQLVNSVLCSIQNSLGIRVRCGGHSYEGTSSVAYVAGGGAPFVIIDMMNLNRVRVDLGSETAWVEGGATLGETYYEIARASKIHGFSAGSCPTVGVGGHISGGGFGLLSRKYGLAADNVVDALLIDAKGRLLDRKSMGEDVFWAIRGGGGGVWGVVYAWKIQLFQLPKTITSFIVSRAAGSKARVAELVNKWQHISPYLDDDFYLSCFVGAGLPESKSTNIIPALSTTFKGLYLGPKAQAISILTRVFPELEILQKECFEMSWIESVVFFSGLANGSLITDLKYRFLPDRKYFKAKSDYVRAPISLRGITEALEILEREPKGYVILDPYGGMMERISSEWNAFPHREGNMYTIQYLVEWNEESNGKRKEYVDWVRGLYEKMTEFVSSSPRAAYINYMDFDLGVTEWNKNKNAISVLYEEDASEIARSWGEKYFLNNYDRLVKAKTIIDPNNVFTNPQGIPPKSRFSTFSQKNSSSN